MTLDHVQSVKN